MFTTRQTVIISPEKRYEAMIRNVVIEALTKKKRRAWHRLYVIHKPAPSLREWGNFTVCVDDEVPGESSMGEWFYEDWNLDDKRLVVGASINSTSAELEKSIRAVVRFLPILGPPTQINTGPYG